LKDRRLSQARETEENGEALPLDLAVEEVGLEIAAVEILPIASRKGGDRARDSRR
jgi:hypothetical protein